MGTNKILKFDGSDTNILSDAQYQSSTERTSGNALNSVASSKLINKALKQATAVANAIGQIVADNNSFDAEDSNPSNIAVGLTNAFQSTKRATNTITAASATWELTLQGTFDTTVPQLVLFMTEVSSQSGQKIKIGANSYDLVYYNGTAVGTGIVASSAAPVPVFCIVSGSKAFFLSDLSKVVYDNLVAHLSNTSNPHGVTASQAGAVPSSGNATNRVLTTNGSGAVQFTKPDTSPTFGSSKPVTSGGVYTALSGKQDALTLPLGVSNGGTGYNSVDNVPTSGSSKMVKSGGVYDAIREPVSRQAPTQNFTEGGTKTLALSDAGTWITCYTANATIKVPTNTEVAFPIGTEVLVFRFGSQTVSFTSSSGANIATAGGTSIVNRYGVACLKKTGTNTWVLFGDV